MQFYEDLENFSQQASKPVIFYQTVYGEFGGFADTIPQECYQSLLYEALESSDEQITEDSFDEIEIGDYTY